MIFKRILKGNNIVGTERKLGASIFALIQKKFEIVCGNMSNDVI